MWKVLAVLISCKYTLEANLTITTFTKGKTQLGSIADEDYECSNHMMRFIENIHQISLTQPIDFVSTMKWPLSFCQNSLL